MLEAGGGSGGFESNQYTPVQGGTGGGTTGGYGVFAGGDYDYLKGGPGTQTSGGTCSQQGPNTAVGSFGQGANVSDHTGGCGGGGGGWYGGGSGYYAGGSGGSGYVGGCISGTTSMSNGQRSGHGYATITLVSY